MVMNELLMLIDKNIPLAAESIKEAYATRELLPRLLSLLLMSLTERLFGISCDFTASSIEYGSTRGNNTFTWHCHLFLQLQKGLQRVHYL